MKYRIDGLPTAMTLKMSSSGRSGSGARKQIEKMKKPAKMKSLGASAQAASKMKASALNVLFPILDEHIRNEVKVPHPP